MSIVISEQAEKITPPSYDCLTLKWAWRFYVRHLRAWLTLVAAPVVVLGVTSLCELWLSHPFTTSVSVVLMEYAIGAVRLLAFSMALASITWFTAAAVLEDAPSVSEAWQSGWDAAWRVGMAVLPLWVITLVYAALAGMVWRAVYEVLRSLDQLTRVAATLVIALVFAPPVVMLMARYLFVVPVAVLTRDLRSFATTRAAALMSWRGVWLTWPYTVSMAALLCLGILLPSLAYVGSLWELIGEIYVNERATIMRHGVALALLCTVGTFGVCGSALLYCAFYAPWRVPAQINDNVQNLTASD